MKNISFFIILLSIYLPVNIYGQSSSPKMYIEAKYKKQYYPEGQDLAVEYSLIGLPLKSIMEEDRYQDGDKSEFYADNSEHLKSTEALPYINQALKNNDIILLNERHNRPEHRVLFYRLLDSLKSFGINSVFLETLAYVDDDSASLSNRTIQSMGLYTHENIYNQVCNKLRRLNYNVYSYEIGSSNQMDTQRVDQKLYLINKTDRKWIPIEADTLILKKLYSKDEFDEREAEQAIHIYQKIIRNRIKKAFIYCGYAHCYKSTKYLAGLLQHLLGKQIFSIDQIHLNEHSAEKFENQVYLKFATSNNPFVITGNNKIIHSIHHPQYEYITDSLIDLSIGSTRSKYINNRPTYLELNGDRRRYPLSRFIDVRKYASDFLVTIYEYDDYERDKVNDIPIPEDVFQVELQAKNYDVIITPNKRYRLFITKDSQILLEKIIEI